MAILKGGDPPILFPIIFKTPTEHHLIEEVEGSTITKATKGHIDPHTKALIPTKGSSLLGKHIEPTSNGWGIRRNTRGLLNGQWHLTTKIKNHIHGYHYLLLSLAHTTFNCENLGWG